MAHGNVARALQGFGAGVAGQGGQFLEQLDEDRKNAVMEDAFGVQQSLQRQDIPAARERLQRRIASIQSLGGDPADTLSLLNKLEAGDIKGALADVTTVVDFGIRSGRITAPQQPTRRVVDGQVVSIDPVTGQATAAPIEGFTQDPGKATDRSLRERQIAVSEATEQRQADKLSAGLESALLKAQDRVVEAQRQSNEFDVLAAQFQEQNIEGGVKSTFSEFLKGVLGTQDDVTEFKRRFNKVRISEGLKNLPPGPASDVDVAMAFRGVPKENASPQQVASFLRGAARLARFEAGFNQFKADFISNKSSARGLGKAWRKSVDAPSLSRKVTIAEIYETAQDEGITPEDVMQQLGITTRLF